MPMYKYRCQNCSSDFETLTKFEQTEPVPCVNCGSHATEREAFPTKARGWAIKGDSNFNHYGLRGGGKYRRGAK